jgi:WD40 repeat protein
LSLANGLLTGQFQGEDLQQGNQEVGGQESGVRSQESGIKDQKSDPGALATGAPTPGVRPDSDSTLSLIGGSSEFSAQSEYHFYRSVARVGLQVADALAYAHGQKVLHRDIKPSNLLLDLQGTIWVTDFGLAKEEESDNLTRTGDIVGTLRYMAPERFSGRADRRSDIYSLGMTLYELLTLRRAFDEMDRARLIQRITRVEPTRPRKLDARIPRDLETMICKATAKEPAERYATAEALAEDLRRFLSDRPIRARRASAIEKSLRWCRRNPAVASLIGLVVGLVLAVAAIAVWDDARIREEQRATLHQLHLTREAEADATRRLYGSYVEQARATRLSGGLGRRTKSLQILDKAAEIARDMKMSDADFLKLRNETIACLAHVDLRVAKRLPGPAPDRLDFDSTLEHYVRRDNWEDISYRRFADDAEIHRLKGDPPHLSPNGRMLAVGHMGLGGRVKVLNLEGREPVEVVPEIACTGYEFSPDSRWIAIGQADGAIRLVELSSGQTKKLKADSPPVCLAFNPKFAARREQPEGRQLAVAGINSNRVQIIDIDAGEPLSTDLPLSPNWWPHVAWHPDGKTLAIAGWNRIISLWDVPSRKQRAQLRGHKHEGIGMVFNHAGDLLASTAWDSLLFLWDPQMAEPLFRTQAWVRALQFSSDDSLLAATSSNGELQLWEIIRPCGYRTLVRDAVLGENRYSGCAVSPDNRLLAAGMNDGVALWDLVQGRLVQFIPEWGAHWLLFERSGTLLINSPAGVHRFLFLADTAQPGLLRMVKSPPLPLAGNNNGISSSADGRLVANTHNWGAMVWHTNRSETLRLSHEHPASLGVSPDGNWVATSSNGARPDLKIWDANSGRLAHTLVFGEEIGQVAFSPDSKWLAIAGHEWVRLWKVRSWEEGLTLAGQSPLVFSPDGKVLAFESGFGAVRLVEPSSGQEYAQLEDPSQDRAGYMTFSPDGRQLVVNGEGQSIHVWDLPAIRQQLAKRNLEGNLPKYPPPAESHDPPIKVISYADFRKRGNAYLDEGKWSEALAEFSRALELDPEGLSSLNLLSWTLVSCPDVKLRDPTRAVKLAQKAVDRVPDDGMIRNTLGAAYYRAGDWKNAIQTLEKSMRLRKGGDSFDWFFLAMAHWRLGEKKEAKNWYDRAVQWLKDNKQTNKRYEEELHRFQKEAADLLGIKDQQGMAFS